MTSAAHRTPARLGVLVVVGVALAACGEGPANGGPEEIRSESTRRMAERLSRRVLELDPLHNEFQNVRRVDRLRAAAPPSDALPLQVAAYRMDLALELLRAGAWMQSVREVEGTLALVDSANIPVPATARRQAEEFLAAAWLRAGFDRACVEGRSPGRCTFPLEAAGTGEGREEFTEALRHYRKLALDLPGDAMVRWLLSLAAMGAGAYPEEVPAALRPPDRLFEPGSSIGMFRDVAASHGVDVLGLAGGGILEDFDGDGRLDVLASSQGLFDQLRFFRNQGDDRFTEATVAAGLKGLVGGLNLVHGDYDNDGRADVLVLRGGWASDGWPNSLLRNRGEGAFSDLTEAAGLLAEHPTQTAAWADFDGDGWLDLYVGNETSPEPGASPHPSELYRNNGDGTFTDVAAVSGVAVRGFVKGVAWGDVDNDGRPDLYVSRLDGPNHLFRNLGPDASGDWRFEDVAPQAGVTEPRVSFPTWFFDFDNDGWLDLFVASWGFGSEAVMAEHLELPAPAERSRLYRNNGDGTFEDVAARVGLTGLLKVMGSNFGDLDNDGYQDLFFGVGEPDMRALIPNRVYRNVAGTRFEEVTLSGGFGHLGKGHGVSFGDVDGDGDQDIYMVLGGAYEGDRFRNVLYRNPGHGNRWIALRLQGVRANRAGIGARLRLVVEADGEAREIHTVVGSGGSFGASSLEQVIGLGGTTVVRRLEVVWPGSGTMSVFEGVEPDRRYLVREGASRLIPAPPASSR